jgi:hypothetical protein
MRIPYTEIEIVFLEEGEFVPLTVEKGKLKILHAGAAILLLREEKYVQVLHTLKDHNSLLHLILSPTITLELQVCLRV